MERPLILCSIMFSLKNVLQKKKKNVLHLGYQLANMDFPGSSVVKNLPAKQEMQVQSLGQEDPFQKEMETHSMILAWENPMDRAAWQVGYSPWDCEELDTTVQLNNKWI